MFWGLVVSSFLSFNRLLCLLLVLKSQQIILAKKVCFVFFQFTFLSVRLHFKILFFPIQASTAQSSLKGAFKEASRDTGQQASLQETEQLLPAMKKIKLGGPLCNAAHQKKFTK